MARARNIKPGFFLNDVLAECDPFARLLFAGLWTIADREGRLEDRPKKIKALVLPFDDVDCNDLLQQLHDHGFILRYEAKGKCFIQVQTWSKHQNPHVKESASEIPAPEENGVNICEEQEKHHTSTVQEQEEHTTNPADSLNPITDSLNRIPDSIDNAQKRDKTKRRTQLPKDFELTEQSTEHAQQKGIDIDTELQAFKDYHQSKGNVMQDWQAAWRTWCGNAVKWNKSNARASPPKQQRESLREKDYSFGVQEDGTTQF